MHKINLTLTLALFVLATFAQNKMRPLDELVNQIEPAWPLVKKWIDSAKNIVEILPCDTVKAQTALYNTQVTTRSPMGAVIYSTGGLLIDSGWIRVLGSGNSKLNRTLPDWNKGKTFKEFGERPGYLLVADDAIGGLFALNGGEMGKDAGKIYYLPPVTLAWEPLNISYSEFLDFCFNADLDKFYEGLRWGTWREETAKLAGDKVFNFVPPLWSTQDKDISKTQRMPVPAEEQYQYNILIRKQLKLDKSEN